jgi:enamine deaminase RidA (YjgF/YER057c/UK114 family)
MSNVNVTVIDRQGRKTASTGSKWEPIIGYSRAVRAGNQIFVTGTVGVNADGKYPAGMGAQARRAFEIIQAALEALGGKLSDVVRTRMFVTDISKWEELGKVHGELFGETRPCTTMVEVAKLIDKEALVEIEADAVVG